MLGRSRLSRRVSRLGELIELLFHQLGMTLKELNGESPYAMDSFPVALCDNIRIAPSRLGGDAHYRGYVASKRRHFYGVRVQMMVTVADFPFSFASCLRVSRMSQAWRTCRLRCPPEQR